MEITDEILAQIAAKACADSHQTGSVLFSASPYDCAKRAARLGIEAALSTQPQAGDLRYRPNEFDDWGMIRNPDGTLYAVMSRPEKHDGEFDEHRRNGTDPFESLARLLMDAASPAPPTAGKHSERLRHGLENVAGSLASRPVELRGPFESGATRKPAASDFARSEEGLQLAAEISDMAGRVGKEFVPFVQPTASEPVAVCQIDWQYDSFQELWNGRCPIGNYQAWQINDRAVVRMRYGGDGKVVGKDIADAKKYAQDDFEACIRSALASPALPSRGELEEKVARMELALVDIAFTCTEDSHGNTKDYDVGYYKRVARAALGSRT